MTLDLPGRIGAMAVGLVGALVGPWIVPQLTVEVEWLTECVGRIVRGAAPGRNNRRR